MKVSQMPRQAKRSSSPRPDIHHRCRSPPPSAAPKRVRPMNKFPRQTMRALLSHPENPRRSHPARWPTFRVPTLRVVLRNRKNPPPPHAHDRHADWPPSGLSRSPDSTPLHQKSPSANHPSDHAAPPRSTRFHADHNRASAHRAPPCRYRKSQSHHSAIPRDADAKTPQGSGCRFLLHLQTGKSNSPADHPLRAASARHPAHGPSSALCCQSRHALGFSHRAGPGQTAGSPTTPRDPPAAHRSGHKSTPCADPQDARSLQAPPDARASRARLRSNPCRKVSRATIRHRHAHHPHAASRSTHWQIGETKTDPQAAGSRRRCSPLPPRPSRRIRRKITDC